MKHLCIDAYEVESALLEDQDLLRRTLKALPALIGMQRQQEPFLEQIKTSRPLDDGMSGILLGDGATTLHVSLHAWPPYHMLNIDLFACQDEIEVQDVLDYLQYHFQIDSLDMEINEIERATRSPRPTPIPPPPLVFSHASPL
ncbi:MAG: S-adenosylmethionine decarboxylase family protein [Ktedonobacteraceae bacterium]